MNGSSRLLATVFTGMYALCAVTGVAADPDSTASKFWHQWRGPFANGTSIDARPPLTWSETSNIRWKVPVPGSGSSTPIIWGDAVFLLTSIPTDRIDPNRPRPEDQPQRPFGITYPNTYYQYVVLCLDRSTGSERWRTVVAEKVPHEGHHGDNNFASASPTTDGKHLYAWFGSVGIFCLNMDGEVQWKKDLGEVNTRLSFGEGSSPVLHEGRLLLTRDNENQSYLVALDATDGNELWRVERDEPSTWATPLVITANSVTQVITNGSQRVRSYNIESGELIWECGGQVANVTPSPVSHNDLVVCMSGYRGSSAMAMPLSARGDISGSDQIAWSLDRGTPYVPSPLLYDGLLYFNQSNNAILTCVEAATGKVVVERTRMPGVRAIYASPVAADGRVYFPGRDGNTLVLQHGREFKVLATNRLDDGFDASPALAGNSLFLRGREFLYCIEQAEPSGD